MANDRFDPDAFVAPTFGQRFLGRIIDGLILFVVVALLNISLNGTALRVLTFVVAAGYEIIGVAIWGQTIGKRVVGTRVVSSISPELLPAQAGVRFLVYGGVGFALVALGLPIVAELAALAVILPILRPPMHRGLHDLAARTIVVPTRVWRNR